MLCEWRGLLNDFIMFMEIHTWVPAVCDIRKDTLKMASAASPVCLAKFYEEQSPQNAMSIKIMCSSHKNKELWL
jgi:hypothetical protein